MTERIECDDTCQHTLGLIGSVGLCLHWASVMKGKSPFVSSCCVGVRGDAALLQIGYGKPES